MQATRFIVCLAAALAGACETNPCEDAFSEASEVTPRIAPMDGDGNQCTSNTCGGNSPVINGVYFWRLGLLGQPNPEGVRIEQVVSSPSLDALGNQPMILRLDENGDRLIGLVTVTDNMGNTFKHEIVNERLMGTRITVSSGGTPYIIIIDKVFSPLSNSAEKFWVGVEAGIETYQFVYTKLEDLDDPNVRPHPLCAEGIDPDKLSALIFGGDLYDPLYKQVTIEPALGSWMNIACVDGAMYKMHKIGYTSAAHLRQALGPGKDTSLEQRQAMFKAWTADVCGDGQSFTVSGEQITLRESLEVFDRDPYNKAWHTPEAIWTEGGAFCLNVPRLWNPTDELSVADQEPICTRIAHGCKPPPCTASQLENWKDFGYVLTGNLDF